MLTVDEILEKLEDRNLSQVANKSGITYQSLLYFVRHNGGSRPDYQMMKKLSDYLDGDCCKKSEPEPN